MLKQLTIWSRSIVGTQAVIIALAAAGLASFAMSSSVLADTTAEQLPAGKQTSLGLYVTSKEAYDKWKAAPDSVTIIDVRTPEEYLFIGHANMAVNIPIAAQSYEWDADKQQFPMVPLADFVARVQKVADPQDTLLVMCRSGGRSAMAVNSLAKAGFKNVYNITDGFEGDHVKDPNSVYNGKRMVNGWKNSGVPWTYSTDPEQMVLPAE
jgi:rhodanese-related sulfurtransferase